MWKKLMKELNLSDSYVSMGLGLLVVLVIGILTFNYFDSKAKPDISEAGEQTEEQNSDNDQLTDTYTVTEGDSLWSIAEKYYESGYGWIELASANKITNPNIIEIGQKISIPKEDPLLTVETDIQNDTSTELQEKYTVQAGDSLWDIAEKVYQDGYRWLDIAQANNLDNPGVIHNGNVLTIPK